MPASLVVKVRSMPVSMFRTITVAPGMLAFCVSDSVPEIVPVPADCAQTGASPPISSNPISAKQHSDHQVHLRLGSMESPPDSDLHTSLWRCVALKPPGSGRPCDPTGATPRKQKSKQVHSN